MNEEMNVDMDVINRLLAAPPATIPNPNPLPGLQTLSIQLMDPAPTAPTDESMTSVSSVMETSASNPELSTTSTDSEDLPLRQSRAAPHLTPIQKRRKRNPTK